MANYAGTQTTTARPETSFALPMGAIQAWHAQIPYALPLGFLICDGSALLSSSYPALYSLIGQGHGNGTLNGNGAATGLFPAWSSATTYSPGNTVTSAGLTYIALTSSLNAVPASSPLAWAIVHGFNLPDYRGRFNRGIDNMGGPSANRGVDIGARSAQLTGGAATNVGSIQGDTFQGHWHHVWSQDVPLLPLLQAEYSEQQLVRLASLVKNRLLTAQTALQGYKLKLDHLTVRHYFL